MKIRSATLADREGLSRLTAEVHELHREARPDVYMEFDPEQFRKEISDTLYRPDSILMVAEEEGELAGMALLTLRQPLNPILKPRLYAFLEELSVGERFRGQGIGTALFTAAKEQALKRGAVSLELQVWSFNEAALRFYEKMGMKEKTFQMELPLQKGESR